MRVGTNIWPADYNSPNRMFLNIAKTFYPWQAIGGATFTQDSDGYVKTLSGGSVQTAFFRFLNGTYPSGSYTVLFDNGAGASLSLSSDVTATITASGQTFSVTTPTNNGILLNITALGSPYLTNLRIVQTKYLTNLNNGEIFDPDFITDENIYQCIRMMDSYVNSTEVNWTDRRPLTYYSWTSSDHAGGIPYEVLIALCNKTNSDCWVNVPLNATNTYITNMANLFLNGNGEGTTSGLNSNLDCYVEFWNEGFNRYLNAGSGPYGDMRDNFVTTAKAQSPVLTDYQGTALTGQPDSVWGYYYQICRSCQMADTWNGIWTGASAARCRPLKTSQTGWCGSASQRENIEFGYTQSSQFTGTCASHHKALGNAPYIASGKPFPIAWTADADGGLTKCFQEMQSGGLLPTPGQCVTTAGTSTAFTATGGPAGADANGTLIGVTFNATAGASPTFSRNGNAAQPIYAMPPLGQSLPQPATSANIGNGTQSTLAYTTAAASGLATDAWIMCDLGYGAGSTAPAPSGGKYGWVQQCIDQVGMLFTDWDIGGGHTSVLSAFPNVSEIICYEGGQSLVDYSNHYTKYQNLIDSLCRDSRMGDCITQLLNGMNGLGITVFNHYYDCNVFEVFGNWGANEYIGQNSARYQALKNFVNNSKHHGGRNLGKF